MTTTVTSVLSTTNNAHGTGLTVYTSLDTWIDACPDLVGLDQIWKGVAYKDGEFFGEITVPALNTGVNNYIWMTTAAGESFREHASKLSNLLKYNSSNGVAYDCDVHGGYNINAGNEFMLVENFQMRSGNAFAVFTSIANLVIKNCIIDVDAASSLSDPNNPGEFWQCAITHTKATPATNFSAVQKFFNCTILRPTDATTGTNCLINSHGSYPTVKNCLVAGAYTNVFAGTLGSYPSPTGYNASTVGTGSMPGSNNVGSLTITDELEGTTVSTLDLRIKSTNHLNVGTRDAAHTDDVDILGQARSLTTPCIGCMEYVSAGSPTFKARPYYDNLLRHSL